MGDITDLFSSVSGTKITPIKAYISSFATTSTTFVDVTGSSITVPAGALYCVRGVVTVFGDTPTRTATFQLLLNGVSVYSTTIAGGTSSSVVSTVDSLILQNNTGASQTAKLQLKIDGGVQNTTFTTGSIITAPLIIPFDSVNYALKEGWQDISSLDFVSCIGNGTAIINFDSAQIKDSTASAVTWNTLEKFCSVIRFYGSNVGYVGFDYTGKYLVL